MDDYIMPIDTLPESAKNSLLEDIRQRNELGPSLALENVPTERICDYVTTGVHPRFCTDFGCLCELRRRTLEYSFDEIMSMCGYIGASVKLSQFYIYTAKVVLYELLARADKDEFIKRFTSEGGFELIGLPNKRESFVQFSQNYSTN